MKCIAANIDLTVYEGGTFDQIFQWKTGELEVPLDITGYTCKMAIRSKIASPDEIISITESATSWAADGESGVYLDDASEGKYRVYVNDTDTSNICVSNKDIIGIYDLFLYSDSGEAVLKQYGVCTIKAAVTR